MPRQRVALMVGASRSGSSVIERVLAERLGLLAVGELCYLWERGYQENQLCTCGKPFHDCLFWSAVVARVREEFASDDEFSFALEAWNFVVLECYFVPLMRLRYSASSATLARARRLVDATYRSIEKMAGGRIILDSSKASSYGFLVAPLRNVDLMPIRVVRDSRGVAYSWHRQKSRPEIHWADVRMVTRRARSVAIDWNLHYLDNLILWRALPRKPIVIRYESFALYPAKVLEAVESALLGGRLPDPVTPLSEIGYHSVAGNPIRFEQTLPAIKLDDEWHSQFRGRDRWTVTALTAPFLAHHLAMTRRSNARYRGLMGDNE